MGSVVLLEGEAGIGKTRLLDEFARRTPGVHVVRGGCIEGVPYAPWTDALWWLTSTDVTDTQALPHEARAQLARLLPQLGDAAPLGEPQATGQQMLFEAVVALLARAAAHTRVAVILDDAHWIDPASRELLLYVAANLRRAPVLLVVAYRPEDSAPQHALLESLHRASSRHITIDRLSQDAAAEIATILLAGESSERDVTRIVGDAGGNPLFIEELVAAAAGSGVPGTLRDLMLVRYESLDVEARHLVRTAALIGERVSHAWLASAIGLDETRARQATGAALASGVLVADIASEGYAFRHALLRQAVLDGLAPDERVALHARIASALEQFDDLVGVDRESELARHWDAAARPTSALRTLISAARRAESRYAFDAAADAYDRALFWWDAVDDAESTTGTDRAALLLLAAHASAAAGRVERAADLGESGLAASIALGPDRGAAAAARVRPLLWAGDRQAVFADAKRRLEPVLGEVGARTRAHFLVESVEHMLIDRGTSGIDATVADMTAALAQVDDPRLLAMGHVALAYYYEMLGDLERSDAEYVQASEAGRRSNDAVLLTNTLYNHAAFCTSLPRLRDCLAKLDACDAVAEQFGVRRYFIPARCVRAWALCELGELDAARSVLVSIGDLAAEGYDAWFRAGAWSLLSAYEGEPDAALAAVDPAAVGSPAPSDFERAIFLASLRALALCQKHEIAAARAAVDEATPAVERLQETFYHGRLAATALRIEADAAVLATAARDLAGIERARARAAAITTRWEAALARLERHHPAVQAYTSALEAERGRLDGTCDVEAARAAADRFEAAEMRYYATYFRWREAEAHLARSERRHAAQLLGRAASSARLHGFTELDAAIMATARSYQLTLGPGRRTVDGEAPLSGREREILHLLADGRTNADIAAALSISRHTARAHVSNILRKLDASTRAEAVAAAQRRGVV